MLGRVIGLAYVASVPDAEAKIILSKKIRNRPRGWQADLYSPQDAWIDSGAFRGACRAEQKLHRQP